MPNGVLIDPDIIRRVRNGVGGLMTSHQALVASLVSRVAAKEKVRSGTPTIASLRYSMARFMYWANVVSIFFIGILCTKHRIDFASAKAG